MPVKISEEKENYIKNNYLTESTKSILEKLNISKPCLLRYARKHNLKIKSSKLYDCDENFFENIDTEDKAYWLGFLYADGYVRKRKSGSEMRLKLSIKDIEHLEKFNKTINSNNDIKQKGRMVILGISQRKFVQHLLDKGCTNKKTFTIKFPNFLKEDLIRHFIRGYFDGDGSIKFTNKKSPSFNLVCGSFEFLESIKTKISKDCNIRETKIYPSKNKHFGSVFWNSIPDTISIFFYMYKDSTVYLNRKKDKFLKIIEYSKTTEKTNRNNTWKRTKHILETQSN